MLSKRNSPETFKNDGRIVSGYGIVFDSPTVIRGERPKPFTEIVRQGSLHLRDDLRLLWAHDPANVLGNVQSGTLTVKTDQRGLFFEATLPESAQREIEAIRRGDVSGMSFSFNINKDRWERDTRELLDISVHEISLVAFPAYADAGITGLRSNNELRLQLAEKFI